MKRLLSIGLVGCTLVAGVALLWRTLVPVEAQAARPANCRGLPTDEALKAFLVAAPATGGTAGGLFNGQRMWGATVNRDGEICSYATSTDDPRQVWPGSQAIAKSKAYTANAFSLDSLALSTARLYTFTQPGHSLWSLGQSNLFDASKLIPPRRERRQTPDRRRIDFLWWRSAAL